MFTGQLIEISSNFEFLEGPVWHRDGYLLFSDIPANRIYRMERDETISIWKEPSGHSNGLTFNPEGYLVACEHGNRRVSVSDPAHPEQPASVLADRYEGKRLNSPNDCVVRSDGWVFFTDPPYGIQEAEKELSFHGVFRVRQSEFPVVLDTTFDRPNGLAFSPDESMLYIADTSREAILVYPVDPDGTIGQGRIFAKAGRPDGMKVDIHGNVYAASTEGIVVFSPQGDRLSQLPVPQRPANCAFGGTDNKTLYITARTSLYKIQVEHPGITPWK